MPIGPIRMHTAAHRTHTDPYEAPIQKVLPGKSNPWSRTSDQSAESGYYIEAATPSLDPTLDPTSDPTLDPILDPMLDPTLDPTLDSGAGGVGMRARHTYILRIHRHPTTIQASYYYTRILLLLRKTTHLTTKKQIGRASCRERV